MVSDTSRFSYSCVYIKSSLGTKYMMGIDFFLPRTHDKKVTGKMRGGHGDVRSTLGNEIHRREGDHYVRRSNM